MGGWVGTNSDDIPSDYLILDKTSKLHFATHHILDTLDLIFYLINVMQVIKYVFFKEGPSSLPRYIEPTNKTYNEHTTLLRSPSLVLMGPKPSPIRVDRACARRLAAVRVVIGRFALSIGRSCHCWAVRAVISRALART